MKNTKEIRIFKRKKYFTQLKKFNSVLLINLITHKHSTRSCVLKNIYFFFYKILIFFNFSTSVFFHIFKNISHVIKICNSIVIENIHIYIQWKDMYLIIFRYSGINVVLKMNFEKTNMVLSYIYERQLRLSKYMWLVWRNTVAQEHHKYV